MLSKFHTNKNHTTLNYYTTISIPSHSFPTNHLCSTQMGKKMKFPFLFKATETTTTSAAAAAAAAAAGSPWPWPACVNNPKTLSFRASTNIYNTINSAYLDDKNTTQFAETPDSFFSIRNSSDHEEIASEILEEAKNDEITAVIRGLRSDRLFFEPGETNSILEEAKSHDFPYKESVKIMALDSSDPFTDFRASMEEMVEAHGLEDWDCLEELLTCYLRVNGKSNHGYIVGAFVDLMINLALASADCSTSSAIDERCSSSSTTTQYSFTSPLSFSSSSTYSSTSPCLSLMENEDEIVIEKNVSSCSSGV